MIIKRFMAISKAGRMMWGLGSLIFGIAAAVACVHVETLNESGVLAVAAIFLLSIGAGIFLAEWTEK
ncbi:MAG: hypothetical protein LBC95_00260 [Candidatus Nomurabacteria bacterium]|jgi:hypothetical protein|nr:hypothetical protein [Candidatus Nomurabacteria bacterium]